MATNYSTSLDSYATLTDNVDDALASHQNDKGDAIVAIETKVGVDNSSVATTIDYFLKHASGAYRTHTHDGTSDDGAQLDWDTCWSDAVHNHSSAGEGGTTLSPSTINAFSLGGKLTAGANEIECSNVDITGGTITGITDLAVADGGTASSTAAGARTNLGAAASGANSDITSLSSLSTPITVAQGGTNSTTASAARTALGLAIGTDVLAYSALAAKMKISTYTGNGSATQAVTGVGFQPKFVALLAHSSSGWGCKSNQMSTYGRYFDANTSSYAEDLIISLDADGFTVGDGGDSNWFNSNGVVYTYVAFS